MNRQSDELYRILLQKLEENGLRKTPQRLAVLKALAENPAHPNIGEIYQQVNKVLPMTSLATVYKIVTALKEIGEVRELSLGEGGSHFDPVIGPPHPHLLCVECGKIVDAPVADLEALSHAAAKKTGYQIFDQQLDFFGLCPECQSKKKSRVTGK